MSGNRFSKVAVIGLGLIGGSVAAAARASNQVSSVCGYSLDGHGQRALERQLIDHCADSLGAAVDDADLVFVATPVSAMRQVFSELAPLLGSTAIVTDCGSTKSNIIQAAQTELGSAFERFVPGHPISGSEFSGPDAARADLFDGKLWLLSPVSGAQEKIADHLDTLLTDFGARCQRLDADRHDALFAEYSHAPHALIFAICQAVADGPNADLLNRLAGAGFRDTTRIGASSATLWTDIIMDNREPVIEAVDRYLQSMSEMQRLLKQGDRAALQAMFEHGSAWRAGLE